MRRHRALAIAAALATSVTAVSLLSTTANASSLAASGNTRHSCSSAKAGFASCFAIVRTDRGMTKAQAAQPLVTPAGYGPSAIQSAYKLSGLSAAGRTVAIVDAYDDPTAEADLAVYRAQFGLPAVHDRQRLLQEGQPDRHHELPRRPTPAGPRRSASTSTWSRRPARRATSCWSRPRPPRSANLGTAVNRAAATAGVVAISNSYGGGERSRTRRTGTTSTTRASRSPRRTGDGGYLGGSFPADVALRHCRRRHVPDDVDQRPRLDRDGVERRRLRLLGVQRQPSSAATFGTGCAKRRDGRRVRGRRPAAPASPSTTPRRTRASPAGWSSAARAPRRRSSRRSTHCPATRRAYPNALPVPAHVGAVRRDERLERHLLAQPAVPGPRRMGRPDRARHTERHRRVLTTPEHRSPGQHPGGILAR